MNKRNAKHPRSSRKAKVQNELISFAEKKMQRKTKNRFLCQCLKTSYQAMDVLLTKQQVMKNKENVYFFNSCFVLVFPIKQDNRNEEGRPNTSKWELIPQMYEEILQCFCILYEFLYSKLGELQPTKMRALVRWLKDKCNLKILKQGVLATRQLYVIFLFFKK